MPKRKNIVLVTCNYPLLDIKLYGATSVCHYFAKEWVKQGVNVRVIFCYTVYSPIFHWIGLLFKKKLGSLFGTTVNSYRFKNECDYEIDGVKVHLIPCYKFAPKVMPQSKKEIDRVCEKIQRYLRNDDYEPDVICSHFLHPSLEIISQLKEVYNVPVGVTIHGEISDKRDVSSIINKKNVLDFWGFRSVPIKNSFIKNCFVPQHHFICSSGIPESYIVDSPLKKHSNNGVTNFIFVGNLIKRKHPLTLVKALDRANINYICTIIGTGSENKAIKKYINKNKRTNVNLLGRLDRLQVLEQMALAECFVMISSSETFGLVYLEAMSKGCITIASRNEGMEGIIIDGENGFLCEAGNGKELSEIIKKINNLDIAEKTKIACNAIDTARRYTDYNVATSYLRELQNL